MTGRVTVFERIRAALGDVPGDERPGGVPIPRDYRTDHAGPASLSLSLFSERVTDYRVTVTRLRGSGTAVIADALAGARSSGSSSPTAPPKSCCRTAPDSGSATHRS